MLTDIRVLVQNGADLNAQDDNGATLVRHSHSNRCFLIFVFFPSNQGLILDLGTRWAQFIIR